MKNRIVDVVLTSFVVWTFSATALGIFHPGFTKEHPIVGLTILVAITAPIGVFVWFRGSKLW